MIIVGLTGGIGSGKSEAARLFADLGAPVVDTDRIAHALTATGQPVLLEIATALGDDILNPDGSLNRALLRQRAFADPEMRKRLEAILHPLIRAHAERQLARHPEAPYQILVVPLLFEARGYRDLIDRSLVIDCDEALQIRRAMARSQLSEAEVRAIMAAQLPREQRLAQADDVIVNDGSLEHLSAQVLEKHEKYIKTCIVSQSIS
jgi:dephospho-CoA kinase